MGLKLEKVGHFFKFFLCIVEKSLSWIVLSRRNPLTFSSRRSHVREKVLSLEQFFKQFLPKYSKIAVTCSLTL